MIDQERCEGFHLNKERKPGKSNRKETTVGLKHVSLATAFLRHFYCPKSKEEVAQECVFPVPARARFVRCFWAIKQAIDADVDGKVGLSDYINFAARLKGIHTLQQQEQQQQRQKEQTTLVHQHLPVAGGDSSARTTPPQHVYGD